MDNLAFNLESHCPGRLEAAHQACLRTAYKTLQVLGLEDEHLMGTMRDVYPGVVIS